MARTSKLLTPQILHKAAIGLERLGKKGHTAIKLMAILAAEKHGITTVSSVFGTTKASLISWIKRLDTSVDQLQVQAGRGRKFLLGPEREGLVRGWIEEDSQITIDRLRAKIEEKLSVRLGRSTVHRLLKRLQFSYITPRPQHNKQDPELLHQSKKKSE